jgi:hypothetical protein
VRIERVSWWARAFAAVILGSIAVAVFAAVRDQVTSVEPVPTGLGMASLEADDQLGVSINSCNKHPTTEVVESPETVTITAYAPPPGINGEDCADGVLVTLDQPLGDRLLVDGSNGFTVPVLRQGGLVPGDQMMVLVQRPHDPAAGDGAELSVSNEELAQHWSSLHAAGRPPRFDPGIWSAVTITSADSRPCAESTEIVLLMPERISIETATEGPAVRCPVTENAELLVLLVPSEAATELSTVDIRGRTVPL